MHLAVAAAAVPALIAAYSVGPRHATLDSLRADGDAFIRVEHYITNCGGKYPVDRGPAAENDQIAREKCVASAQCYATTQGDTARQEQGYYICPDESYVKAFTAAKDKDVFIKTAKVLSDLNRTDVLATSNAKIPTAYCQQWDEAERVPLSHVVHWPVDKHNIGVQLVAEISGGGVLEWGVKICNTGLTADTDPQPAANSLYLYFP